MPVQVAARPWLEVRCRTTSCAGGVAGRRELGCDPRVTPLWHRRGGGGGVTAKKTGCGAAANLAQHGGVELIVDRGGDEP
jgi:hypothetical protein